MTTNPQVVRTRADLSAALDPRPEGGRAVVMTMGALHAGHLSLVRQARASAAQVVVTIFVNPLQFGADEDLESYPRDLPRDLALLADAGADIVFAPEVSEVYPHGEPTVRVSAGDLGGRLEGRTRPGHLDGALTVVLKLLHLVRPDVALFGQKDAQQAIAVRRMVADLDVDVEVVVGATVREADGVALSSRNAYLSSGQRAAATALRRALLAGAGAAAAGRGALEVRDVALAVLAAEPEVVMDYLAVVDPDTARDVPDQHAGPAVLVLAAWLGATRLLDNEVLSLRGPAPEEDR